MLTARVEDAQSVRFYECSSVQYNEHGFLDFHRGECIAVVDGPTALLEIVEQGRVFIMNKDGHTIGKLSIPKNWEPSVF